MGTLPDFRTFPPDDLLGLFTCQRGYLQGYKTSKIAYVAICGRSCHIMPVLKGLGTRKLRLRLGGKYSGVSEKNVQRVMERSRKYQLLKARFDNKPILHPIQAKEVNVRHQCDLVDLQKWDVCYRGVRYRYVLSILDVFSRYVWLRPLTGKKSADIAEHMIRLYEEVGCPRIL